MKTEEEPSAILCPYLDTVNRTVLDFDFEKSCSVTGNNFNVYACLVCGRYFQGRGRSTPAYMHSLQEDHHVVMNLHTGLIFCLPDGYEVVDASLRDIQDMLHPRFDEAMIARLDTDISFARGIDGGDYLPGAIGLNNIRGTDFVNAVVQCLVRIPPLRDFFLLERNYAHVESALVHQFGLLTRKMWSPHNFKGQVSPHELMQAVAQASGKRFAIGKQSDAHEFLAWLLHRLHLDLGGSGRPGSSIVHRVFQGEVLVRHHARIKKRKATASAADEKEGTAAAAAAAADDADADAADAGSERWRVEEQRTPFLYLTIDVPPMPLFRDALDRNIIPQVPLTQCMAKFDGETFQDLINGDRRQFRVLRMPAYLIIHVKRFTKNTQQLVEKNHTIVNCPIKNLDLAPFCEAPKGATAEPPPLKFDLICSVQHDGKPEGGAYKAHVHFPANGAWYEMQDLHVGQVHPQLISVSESYVQIYKRCHAPPADGAGAAERRAAAGRADAGPAGVASTSAANGHAAR